MKKFLLSQAVAIATINVHGAMVEHNLRKRSFEPIIQKKDHDDEGSRKLNPSSSLDLGTLTVEIGSSFSIDGNTRIVGGDATDSEEYPYFVLMPGGGCGGTLIAPTVVLTAAHCKPHNYLDQKVSVGPTGRYYNSGQKIKVIAIATHPNYASSSFNNDFAVLLLEEPYNMNSNIQLGMNEHKSIPADNAVLNVIGMGRTSYNGNIAYVLTETNVPAISNDECKKANIRYKLNIMDSMICAGRGVGQDACQGDSGGPLVKKDGDTHTLIGIVSWGIGCATHPGVYSRVSAGLEWMKSIVCDEWNTGSSEFCGGLTPTSPLSLPPTPAPVQRPSSAPITQDTLKPCQEDDPDFFKNRKRKNCKWVAKKPYGKGGRCRKKHDGKKIGEFCPTTCSKNRCQVVSEKIEGSNSP